MVVILYEVESKDVWQTWKVITISLIPSSLAVLALLGLIYCFWLRRNKSREKEAPPLEPFLTWEDITNDCTGSGSGK